MAYIAVYVVLFFVQLIISIIKAIVYTIYYVMRCAPLADFLLVGGGGTYLLTSHFDLSLTHSGIIAIIAAALVVLLILKIKYIRFILLTLLGSVWAYGLYKAMFEVTICICSYKVALYFSLAMGILYLIGHVKQGMDCGSFFVYDPIGWLVGRLWTILITFIYTQLFKYEKIREETFVNRLAKLYKCSPESFYTPSEA